MIKAIFFDIDGTLLSFKTRSVPQSAVDALAELKRRGICVFIATGRSAAQIDNVSGLGFDGYITFNGCLCLDAGYEPIHENAIPREDLEAVARYQEEKEPFPCAFMSQDEVRINYIDQTVIDLAQLVNLPVPGIKPLREAAKNKVMQVNIYVDKDRERELMRKVFTRCSASRWNPLFADINVRGASKQTGIDRILEHYGITLNETMAFGDGGNDIPMLRHVALGVAMGNASDEVKRVADYVTDSVDEHGIRNALQHFKLIG